jgi:glycosyltransferase involved in cell wall biosynthesis
MKVLYIGHYKDGTGWGDAAQNNILALHQAGIEVIPRAITFEDKEEYSCHPVIESLESGSTARADVVIQHTLPSCYVYDGRFYNIGCFTTESSDFRSTGWQHHMNMMDEIWVPTETAELACVKSGVKVKISVVPYGIGKVEVDPSGQKIKELNENFTFGFVGEFIERKNVKALIKAFHMTFEPHEPVNLFIKTSKSDLPSVHKYIQHIKNGMKTRKNYKEEVVIAGMMSKKDYYSVLSQVDCFVMPSRGESPCIPAMEALSLGIPVMRTSGIGMPYTQGLSEVFPAHVKSYDTPCFGAIDTLPNLDTSASTWKEIDIIDLGSKMRLAVSKVLQYKKPAVDEVIDEIAQSFTLESVGIKMKEVLDAR